MSWLSLAANRFEIKAVLQRNLADAGNEEMRLKTIRSLLSRYALLSGDEFHINREIGRAEILLTNYHDAVNPPSPFVISDVLDLAIVASLGDKDFSGVIESIAKASHYQESEDRSVQLFARRIVGAEETPGKSYKKRGHIEKPSQWLRLVKEFSPADVFNLAVTLEHPESYLLEKYILPSAFLLARAQEKEDWRKYFKGLLSWGSAGLEERKNIVYERTFATPDVEVKINPADKKTWRGFDAVELKGEEVFAYYYLGVNWHAPLFFQEEINVYSFLDNREFDWMLVEETIDAKDWQAISDAINQNKCTYVVVYDAAHASAPEPALDRARRHYGLNIITFDITEI